MKYTPELCELWFDPSFDPVKAAPSTYPDLFDIYDQFGYYTETVEAWRVRKFHDPKSEWSKSYNEKVEPILATKHWPRHQRPNLNEIEQMYKELE